MASEKDLDQIYRRAAQRCQITDPAERHLFRDHVRATVVIIEEMIKLWAEREPHQSPEEVRGMFRAAFERRRNSGNRRRDHAEHG